jgi:hypothetical protein
MSALSNAELTKHYILTEIRLRWLIRKLQDKNIITEAEFQEIWNSWDEQGEKK